MQGGTADILGLVVKSIVSLTSLLGSRLVK